MIDLINPILDVNGKTNLPTVAKVDLSCFLVAAGRF